MEKKNLLVNEKSPYLLQHKDNPVHWRSWSEEAFKEARDLQKPLLISIGYSACHWCHVMAHESFENEDIALIMNEKFINIKVDREERPDIDAVYMKSVVALTGRGGWPMSVFLTPDCKPYFGGTYYPPSTKYNRPGFPEVLEQAYALYKTGKVDLENRAKKIMQQLSVRESTSKLETISAHLLIDEAPNPAT